MVWKELFEILLALDIARIGINFVLFMERRFKSQKDDDEGEFNIYE